MTWNNHSIDNKNGTNISQSQLFMFEKLSQSPQHNYMLCLEDDAQMSLE